MIAKSNLARAIYVARQELDWSLAETGKALTLSAAGLNRLETFDRRPDVATLRALVSHWPVQHRQRGLRLLVEHLRDEVQRSGADGRSVAVSLAGDGDDPEIAHALSVLRRDAALYSHVRELLLNMAHLQPSQRLIAAEGKPSYGKRR